MQGMFQDHKNNHKGLFFFGQGGGLYILKLTTFGKDIIIWKSEGENVLKFLAMHITKQKDIYKISSSNMIFI